MANTGYLLEYTNIFDDPQYSISRYLDGFGFDLIVKFSTHLLSLENKVFGYDQSVEIISKWFSEENKEIQTHVIKKVNELDKSLKQNLSFIHPYTVLTLFEYSFNTLPEISTISQEESEVNLFKCMLVLNENYNQRDQLVVSSTKHLDKKTNLPAL